MAAHKKRRWIPAALALLLPALLLLGGDAWTRLYVRLHAQRLEDFAVSALAGEGGTRYGGWDVFPYPEKGMVEFYTGGFGLAPSTVYKGFYYSAGDVHIPFQAVDQPMEANGDTARWREPESDNRGTSRRVAPRWFWFEARF